MNRRRQEKGHFKRKEKRRKQQHFRAAKRDGDIRAAERGRT